MAIKGYCYCLLSLRKSLISLEEMLVVDFVSYLRYDISNVYSTCNELEYIGLSGGLSCAVIEAANSK